MDYILCSLGRQESNAITTKQSNCLFFDCVNTLTKQYKANISSALNNYHLTTKEQEPETGLYYFYARWYDPQVGRFITWDPILRRDATVDGCGGCSNVKSFTSPFFGNTQDVHTYTIVRNNPLFFEDPYGLADILLPPEPGDEWDYLSCMIWCMSTFIGVCLSPCLYCLKFKHPIAIKICVIGCMTVETGVCGYSCHCYCKKYAK